MHPLVTKAGEQLKSYIEVRNFYIVTLFFLFIKFSSLLPLPGPPAPLLYPPWASPHPPHLPTSCRVYSPIPVLSILEAVLTVSPNKQYLGIRSPTTPATQGPERSRSEVKYTVPQHQSPNTPATQGPVKSKSEVSCQIPGHEQTHHSCHIGT